VISYTIFLIKQVIKLEVKPVKTIYNLQLKSRSLQLTVVQYIKLRPVRLAYQPPANSTFLSEQTSHQQPASSTFFSEQISISHQPQAKRTSCLTDQLKSL
jgi:hypothetical protein